jgi:putative endonuclease
MSEGFAPGSTRDRGARVEQAVATLAERRGLEILERNADAGGVEIDIIARDPGVDGEVPTIVFIEVRSRADDVRGRPAETVGARKQARLVRGATAWLVAAGLWEQVNVRFDVVGVTLHNDEAPEIEWITGAFEVDG